jgi:hypothetical protein
MGRNEWRKYTFSTSSWTEWAILHRIQIIRFRLPIISLLCLELALSFNPHHARILPPTLGRFPNPLPLYNHDFPRGILQTPLSNTTTPAQASNSDRPTYDARFLLLAICIDTASYPRFILLKRLVLWSFLGGLEDYLMHSWRFVALCMVNTVHGRARGDVGMDRNAIGNDWVWQCSRRDGCIYIG